MKSVLLFLISLYRALSPFKGQSSCRFLPTCSEYAAQAIDKHGACKGGWLAMRRLCRCHPWGGDGVDEVP